jgi:hypothetical protein
VEETGSGRVAVGDGDRAGRLQRLEYEQVLALSTIFR